MNAGVAVPYRNQAASPLVCGTHQTRDCSVAVGSLTEPNDACGEAIELAGCDGSELGLAEIHAARGQIDEGIAIYERHLATAPDRGQMLIAFALTSTRRTTRCREAVASQKVSQLMPDHSTSHAMLGDIAIQQGRKADALVHYEAAFDWTQGHNCGPTSLSSRANP